MKAVIPSPRSWFSSSASSDPFILSSSAPPCSFQPNKQTKSVLVQVHAASINPVDYKLPLSLAGKSFPGIDFCGTIVQVGSDVSEFVLGDLVYGASSSGSLAEYTIAPTNTVAKAASSSSSSSWSVFEYAALPVAYQTVLQALQRGQLVINATSTDLATVNHSSSSKSLLIIGASGGCGIAGLQLAKALKISRIVAICSGKNTNLVLELGATEVVDYTQVEQMNQFFKNNKEAFDCVLDAASNSGGGEDYWTMSESLLKPNGVGKFVALNGPLSKWIRELSCMSDPNSSILLCKSNTKDLESVVQLLDTVNVRPMVEILPFTEDGVKKAFDLLKSRRTRGKIVLDILK